MGGTHMQTSRWILLAERGCLTIVFAWLFWLPLPFGLASWWLFRRRYGRVPDEPGPAPGSLPSASSASSVSSASSSSP